jgi:hypothetical protein
MEKEIMQEILDLSKSLLVFDSYTKATARSGAGGHLHRNPVFVPCKQRQSIAHETLPVHACRFLLTVSTASAALPPWKIAW